MVAALLCRLALLRLLALLSGLPLLRLLALSGEVAEPLPGALAGLPNALTDALAGLPDALTDALAGLRDALAGPLTEPAHTLGSTLANILERLVHPLPDLR